MSDNLKKTIDRILYAVLVAALLIFIMGMIFAVRSMTTITLWFMMFTAAGLSGMQVYEYLWRNKDETKEKPLLIEMIATVAVTLLIISLTIFFLNDIILSLPPK